MKYKVSNVNEMRQAAEKIQTDNEKTYILESAAGKHYIIDFEKYNEGVLPFWIVTASHDEVENPFYVEPAPVVVEEEETAEVVDELPEEEPDFDDSDEQVALREEIEKLRNENEALKQNVVTDGEEVPMVEVLECISLGDFIEFVAKHCKK